MKSLHYAFILLALFGITACGTESADTTLTDQLSKRWEIREASRNGRITESLDQLYFDFTAEGTLQTNLAGATETGTYELKEQQILQRGTQIDADYKIESISDTLLVLSTSIRNSNFKFELVPTEISDQ
ncbi:MAG: hypothetical protein AB8G22_00260 [Saprospiraceae bacterium]